MSFDYKRWKEQQYSPANNAEMTDTTKPADNGCPTVIFLIGLIWLAVGLIQLLSVLLYFLKTGRSDLVGLSPWGVMHLFGGLRTLTGTAPGTVRNGIASVFFGLLWGGIAITSAESALTSPNAHPNAPLLLFGFGAAGFALLLAGCLAFIYAGTYQRWIDPYGSRVDTATPDQKQRVEKPTPPREESGPKPSLPVWAWILAGCGVLAIVLLGGASLLLLSFLASYNPKPRATIESYGRYVSRGQMSNETNRNGSGGAAVVKDDGVVLLEQTDQIPCKIGEKWGIGLRTSHVPANRPYLVRQEMHHPPIKFPDGSVRTKSVKEEKVRHGEDAVQFYGWYFLKSYEYELIAGEWTIVVFIDGVEVARKTFHVQK